MKAHRAETPHTTLQKDTFEFIMTDQQTAEPHPHPAQLREAPSDLLADLRAKIDVIDAKLSALIVERLAIADEIGERKRGRNLPIHAPKREEALLEKLVERVPPNERPIVAAVYELLIAVILSAQCTDERVNKVTAELFKEHNTPETMLLLSQEQLEKYIFSCGLYKSKAAHILSATKDIVERFGGQVPESFSDLKSLAGVGQKTANVVSAVWFDKDAIAVDTHVFRVSNRLGLADANTPLKTEEQLKKVIPQKDWSKAHHWLIYHGRRVCHSQKPDCGNCALREYCDYYKQK